MSGAGLRARMAGLVESLHDETTRFFAELDGAGSFREDRWQRSGGGGGVSRVLTRGATFEKAGINRSIVEGTLPPGVAQRLGSRAAAGADASFFAAGVSLVVHPQSPRVPTVHLNVRYLEIVGPAGPTTATRMDKFTRMMLEQGLLAMVGKAERGGAAIEAIKDHRSAYLMAVGGAAYLVARAIKGSRVVGFADLGMEAIYEFEVEDFPVTVAVDSAGQSVHHLAPLVWQDKIRKERLLEGV